MTGRQTLDRQVVRLTKAIHLLWDQGPEIWYRWNDIGIIPIGANVPIHPVVVHPRQFIEKFDEAVVSFRAAMEHDAELGRQVDEQAMKLWTLVFFPPTLEKGRG